MGRPLGINGPEEGELVNKAYKDALQSYLRDAYRTFNIKIYQVEIFSEEVKVEENENKIDNLLNLYLKKKVETKTSETKADT